MAQKTFTPEEWDLYVTNQLGPRPQIIGTSPVLKAQSQAAQAEWDSKKNQFDTAFAANNGVFDTSALPTAENPTFGSTASLDDIAMNKIAEGGNTAIYNKKENEGSFSTTGQQAVQTNQNTEGTQETAQTQTSLGTSEALGSLSGTTAQTGQNVSTVQDTLGLGALLGQQGQQAATSDAVRNQFLSGTVQSGTGQLQRNVGDAVAQALSGPGMINAGEGARARAIGAATQAVARDEFNNQLAASGQLNQLSGLGQLAQVGQGYTGRAEQTNNLATTQQDTSQQNITQGLNSLSGTTQTNQSTTGSQNTQSSQSGTSNVASTGIGFGEQPMAEGGGGSFICAICAKHGFLTSPLIKQVAEKVKQNKNSYKNQIIGYYSWSQPIAKLLLKIPFLCGFVAPFAEQICKGFIEETPTKGQKFLLSVFNYLNSLGFLFSKGKFPNIDPKLLEVVKEYYEPLTFE